MVKASSPSKTSLKNGKVVVLDWLLDAPHLQNMLFLSSLPYVCSSTPQVYIEREEWFASERFHLPSLSLPISPLQPSSMTTFLEACGGDWVPKIYSITLHNCIIDSPTSNSPRSSAPKGMSHLSSDGNVTQWLLISFKTSHSSKKFCEVKVWLPLMRAPGLACSQLACHKKWSKRRQEVWSSIESWDVFQLNMWGCVCDESIRMYVQVLLQLLTSALL